MQLKPYQKTVLADLAAYITQLSAGGSLPESFCRYWQQQDPPLTPEAGKPIKPYKEGDLPDVPHVCVKVPTGGGKTLMACHALGTLLGQVPLGRPRLAVWLVPSLTILNQTLNALRDPRHPYGQALRMLFGGRVEIIDKVGLQQGQGLLDAAAGEQLTVAILSFDSIRTRNPDNRKNFQQNPAHQSLVSALGADGPAPLPDTDATATINALRKLEPVIIVDEAHNASTPLSIDMLRKLAPSFVLEFTATPTSKANIISFVSAQALKDEQMVKLPVVVYNHHDKEDVINAALRLRKRLETLALAAHRKNGAPMIRPIVLFQAQPRNADEVADPMTYRKLKQQLRGLGIPEEHIKIKTGDLDELGRIDLLAPNCEVRYIITVNALKEGWDCSYAYILASLANRSSPVEVEQLVGRVLRQPRATHHPVALLNLSYVLTASAQFDRTLKHIVAGLNEAGFSKDDYRAIEAPNAQDIVTLDPGTQTTLALDPVAFDPVELDVSRLRPAPALPTEAAILAAEAELTPTGTLAQPPEVSTITHEIDSSLDAADVNAAAIEAAALTAFATAAASAHAATTEVVKQVKTYAMRKEVALLGQNLRLPYFVRPAQGMFAEPELLERGDLLAGFDLTKKRIDLRFDSMPTDMWQIDVEQQENGYAPRLQKPNERLRQELIAVFESSSPAGQRRAVVKELTKLLSLRQNTVSDGKLKTYLEKVFADASPAMLREAKERADDYAQVIRRFINQEQTAHALDEFEAQLISSDLVAGLPYSLPSRRTVVRPANPLAQSLYEQEEDGNTLEADMMSILASAENIAFWTRNPALIKSGGFRLNGPVLNHFPDFITQTRKGKVLLIETKGDDRDNSDSAAKIRLGKAWETAASKTWEGSSATSYHYFMVFKTAGLPGSFSVPKFLEQLARL